MVLVGLTVMAAVDCPPSQVKPVPPAAVRVAALPLQILVLPEMLATGSGFMVIEKFCDCPVQAPNIGVTVI